MTTEETQRLLADVEADRVEPEHYSRRSRGRFVVPIAVAAAVVVLVLVAAVALTR